MITSEEFGRVVRDKAVAIISWFVNTPEEEKKESYFVSETLMSMARWAWNNPVYPWYKIEEDKPELTTDAVSEPVLVRTDEYDEEPAVAIYQDVNPHWLDIKRNPLNKDVKEWMYIPM